jgi:hypothetical protein
MSELETQIRKLSLQKGDILVIQKSLNFNSNYWLESVIEAGKAAGIDFSVPIVFVDNIDEIAVIKLGQNGY